ncbi:MAG: FtsX-like permease family protein [Chitinophagales bacterium]
MLKSIFQAAVRNLSRQKAYSFFNIIGLALGMACGLILTLHIREELSYEKQFSKYERIFRMVSTEWSKSSPPLAGELQKFYPEIKSIARFAESGRNVFRTQANKQTEASGYFADSSAVEVFDFTGVAGDPVKALSEPFSVVITESLAKKLFGKDNPLQQALVLNDNDTVWVRAVIKDPVGNSHLSFDYLQAMTTFYKFVPQKWLDNRGWMFGWTYVLFNRKEDVSLARNRLKDFYIKYLAGTGTEKEISEEAAKAQFQPLTDIHLKSDLIQEMGPNSNILYIYIFIAVEVLIILIACVNFINLFTTQSLKRSKEVGLRKLLGASKSQLVGQFMGEAFILTFCSFLLAMLVFQLSLPFYNSITGRFVKIWELTKPINFILLICIILVVGLIAGIFPALFVSGFKPIDSLKGNKLPHSSASMLRKGLVVFQFVVSGLLITSTILIYQQTQLFRNMKVGFNKDQVIVARLYGDLKNKLIRNQSVIKDEVLKNPNVLFVAKASNTIGDDLSIESVVPANAAASEQFPSVRVMRIDEHYLDALSIELKAGRNFSKEFNDSASFLINEKAAEALKLKDPLNSLIVNNTMNLKGKVIGVIHDFHFASLHHQIEPLVLEYRPEWAGSLFIKIRAGHEPETIAFLKSVFTKISPNSLFSYGFLDQRVSGLYKKEDNMSGILKVFTYLAIVISCLGLFGLIAHSTEVRTKEIGIRKVIGAGTGNLVTLLSKDLIILVLLGNLIAWPIAWWLVNKWLQEFTYRINIHWSIFLISALITVIVALFTMSYHCVRAAVANPVKSLRTE